MYSKDISLGMFYLLLFAVVDFFSGVSATLAALTPRLKDFHQLLEDPPPVSGILFLLFDLLYMPFLVQLLQHKHVMTIIVGFFFCQMKPMLTTVGTLDPPLGNARLQTSKLIAAILATNSDTINAELANLGTLQVLWVCIL